MPQPDTFLSTPLLTFLTASGLTAVASESGVWYYDLTSLLQDGDTQPAREHEAKFSLFVSPTKFTLVANSYINKTVGARSGRERTFKLWRKNWSIVFSAKENQGSAASFNIYLHMAGKGLKNYTSHPNQFTLMVPTRLHQLMLACARDLFERRLDRVWRPVPENDRVHELFASTLLYNTYPGFFTDLTTLPERLPVFLQQIPSALYPLLREPDTTVVVENLFGADAPAGLCEAAERGLPSNLLTAGYLFGRRIDAQQIFDRVDGMVDNPARINCLKEMRQLLNRCDDGSTQALFNDYINQRRGRMRNGVNVTSMVDRLLQNAATDRLLPRGVLFRRIPTLHDIETFRQLEDTLIEQLDRQRTTNSAAHKSTVDELTRQLTELLDVRETDDGRVGYWFMLENQRLQLWFRWLPGATPNKIDLLRLNGDRINPGMLLIVPGLAGVNTVLPARHSLYEFFAAQRAVGSVRTIPKRHDMLQVTPAVAADFLRDLHACLQRITKRHGLPNTPGSRSAVLGMLYVTYHDFPVYDQTGHKRHRPPVPAHLYDYLHENIDPATTLLGLRWHLTPQAALRYRELPESFLHELTVQSPYKFVDDFDSAF